MGQLWTDEMQVDLERWQLSQNKAEVAADPIDSEQFQLGDVIRGLAAYCVAVIQNKLLRGAPPVWSLADEISYAGFLRRLHQTLDPEIEALIDADLDIFEGVKCYRA
jgi:hypothetical protein